MPKDKEIELLEKAEKKIDGLFALLKGFSSERERKVVLFVTSSFEKELSNNKNFYKQETSKERAKIAEQIIARISLNLANIDVFVRFEAASPFGVFNDLFQLEIPDLILSNAIIKVQINQDSFKNFYVPADISGIFKDLLQHFLTNQKFLNDAKLDVSDPILDCAFDKFRMNIVHESLSNTSTPIVSVRKHITGKESQDITKTKGYIESTECTDTQLAKMLEYSNKSIVIFGVTGSAKTTMLRYLTNHNLDNKRNVIVIEDTPELFVKTGISLITNKNKTIQDLFKAALRQNPSHLVIGETRTDEIVDILESGLTVNVATTIHAMSIQKAIARIYFMALPRKLNREDINSLIVASIDMFIFMENKKVKEVWARNEVFSDQVVLNYSKIE